MSPMSSIHYKYWIGILIFIIVLIVTAWWSGVPDIVGKFSFALTMSSVILALLAIYFTINFNSLFSNNIATFLRLNKDIKSTAIRLSDATDSLNQKLDKVPDALRGIHDKIDESLQLNIANQEAIQGLNIVPNVTNIIWTDNYLRSFFLSLQYTGMLSLFLVAQAKIQGKQINVNDFDKKIPEISYGYFAGLSTVCGAIDLYKIERSHNILIIKTCNEKLIYEAGIILELVLKDIKKASSVELYERFESAKSKIFDYVCTAPEIEK